MPNRSEYAAKSRQAWARGPRGGALLAALLMLAILLPLWLLAVGWYRAELLSGDPGQRSLVIFEAGGLIVMALLAGLVYLSVNRQAALSQAVQQRTHEITRINQRLAEDLAQREHTEKELRRSDERYRALARSFPNGAVFLYDAQLRYTLADGAGLADVGLTKETLEGLTIWEALPPDTVATIEPHYRAALAGEPHVFEAEFGERLYVVRTLPLRDDDGHIIAGMVVTQDITETKQAEQLLHRWSHIFEHAEWGVAIGSADGRTLEMMNPAYARMHGYTVEELSRQPISSVFAPGTAAELSALVQAANETGHAVMESKHTRKDGSIFPVSVDLTAVKDAHGNVLYRVANVQDITERKQAEAQLRASEAELRALFAAMPDVILVLDAQGRYLRIAPTNPSFARRPTETLIGQTLHDVFAAEEAAEFLNHLQAALHSQQPVQADYNLLVDGELIWYTATFSPLPNDTVLLVARDITARKRSEEALRASEARNRALVNAIPDLMLRMSRDGVYLDVHADRASSWNIPPEAMIGLNIRDMPLERSLVESILRTNQAALDTGLVQTLEYSVAWPGGVRHYEGRNVASGTSEVVVIVRDITERKQSEEALRRSQQQYEQLVNSIDGIVWEGDAQTGLFTFVSPAAERILGYPIDLWLTEPTFWIDRLHPNDRAWVVDFCATATAALRPHECEYRMLAADGRSVWLRETVSVIAENNQPRVLRGMMIDITERKRVEEALREREEQYRSIFEASLDGLFINSLDGYVIDVNPAGAHMHGYTVDECRGIRSEQLVPPDRLSGLEEFIATARTGGQFRSRGFDQRKDGSAFPVEVVGTQFMYRGEPHALAVVRDITERVKVEQILHERELQYRNIFESSLDGLAVNSLDGQLMEFNPAMAQMHGYTVDEFRHIKPEQFIHPDSLPLFAAYMETVKAGREYRCRAMDVRKDGSLFYVEVVGTPFTLRGEPHAFAIVRDIDAQVETEQLLERRVTERTRELRALLNISTSVASTLELKPLLQLILDQLKVLIDYRGAALFALHGAELIMLEYRGPLASEQLRLPVDWWTLNLDMVRRGEFILIADTHADTPLAHTYRAWAGDLLTTSIGQTRTLLAIPLTSKEVVIGLISLTYDEPNHFTESHINLVRAIANQAAIAIENARLFTEAQGKAVLEERQRLARDLHDSVTQSLYSLTLLAEAGRRLMDQDVPQAACYVSDMGEIAQQALKEMRLLVYQLRPLALEREGLIGALQARLDSVEKRAGVEARFLIEGNLDQLPPALEEGLFRVAQEALNNALKHAAARSVVVRLRGVDGHVTLEVTDDGRGAVLLANMTNGGLGLTSMKERVAQLQGTLTIDSAPGRGTRVAVEAPRLSAPEAQPA